MLSVLILLALAFGFLNGFHDAANSIATVVATRVMSVRVAVWFSATFNFLAYFFVGTAVANTIGKFVALDGVAPVLSLSILLCGLIGAIVFMLDRAMCVSDWSLTGVLRSGRPSLGFYLKVAGRVAVAMLLAIATASGVVLALCAGAIDQHMRLERQTRNQPVIDEVAAAKREVRARVTGPLAAELEVLHAERVRLQRTLEDREAEAA